MNAMKTTAAHSSKMNLMSFTQQQQQQQTTVTATSQIQNLNSPKDVLVVEQQADSGTPIAASSTMRSSATPETTTTIMQETAKGPGGKKKKKRRLFGFSPFFLFFLGKGRRLTDDFNFRSLIGATTSTSTSIVPRFLQVEFFFK